MAQGNVNGPSAGIAGLEADAIKMMRELDGIVGKIKELSKAKPDDLRDAAATALHEQMATLQRKLGQLTADHKETLAKIDQSVRANPYVYIAGALGLGVLLGKAMRS